MQNLVHIVHRQPPASRSPAITVEPQMRTELQTSHSKQKGKDIPYAIRITRGERRTDDGDAEVAWPLRTNRSTLYPPVHAEHIQRDTTQAPSHKLYPTKEAGHRRNDLRPARQRAAGIQKTSQHVDARKDPGFTHNRPTPANNKITFAPSPRHQRQETIRKCETLPRHGATANELLVRTTVTS
jgi:hypothetical protein